MIYEIVSTAVITVGILFAVLYGCGIRLYHVKSGSMGELLPIGCVCFVSTYSRFETIETGDVISFQVSDDMLVTHRAVQITAEGIRTQGDENEQPDPDPVTRENYIGKTVFALPRLGKALAYFHSQKGKLTLAAAAFVLLITGFFYEKQERVCEDDREPLFWRQREEECREEPE